MGVEGTDAKSGESTPMMNGYENTPKISIVHSPDRSKTKEDESPTQRSSNARAILAQFMVAGGVFLLGTSAGFPIGFSAVLLPQLQHPNSTLPTDENMGSWIASIHSAATPLGSFFSGMLTDRWGRKLALQISVIPSIIGWAILSLSRSHALILIGRVICGLAVGLSCIPSQVILGEVAEPKIRGLLGGTPYVSYSLGILIVYALGAIFHWQTASALGTILPVLALLAFTFLPDSPVWLIRNNRIEDAKRALIWLRGGDMVKVRLELQDLVSRVRAENEAVTTLQSVSNSERLIPGSQRNIEAGGRRRSRTITGSQKILTSIRNIVEQKRSTLDAWKSFRQPEILKPFLIVGTFNLLQIICGTYLVIFYAVTLISEADGKVEGDVEKGMEVNPFFAAVLTAVVRFIFICVTVTVLFWVGRRKLAIASGIGTSIAALTLGIFLYLNEEGKIHSEHKTWIITGLILLYVAANTMGFFVIPGISIGELLPSKIRGIAGGTIFGVFNLLLFFIAKIFPFLTSYFRSYGIFWFFGTFTLFGTVFVYLFFPESKGRTLEEVEDYFKEKNILWITRSRQLKKSNAEIEMKA